MNTVCSLFGQIKVNTLNLYFEMLALLILLNFPTEKLKYCSIKMNNLIKKLTGNMSLRDYTEFIDFVKIPSKLVFFFF